MLSVWIFFSFFLFQFSLFQLKGNDLIKKIKLFALENSHMMKGEFVELRIFLQLKKV